MGLTRTSDQTGTGQLPCHILTEDTMADKCDACAVPLVDDSCPSCGVWHGDPCPDCGRRGYHQHTCPALDEPANVDAAYL